MTESSFSIQPNPAPSHFFLNISPEEQQTFELNLISIHGQIMFTKSIDQHSTEVDVTGLATGIYFVQLVNENNEILGVEKLMIGQ